MMEESQERNVVMTLAMLFFIFFVELDLRNLSPTSAEPKPKGLCDTTTPVQGLYMLWL